MGEKSHGSRVEKQSQNRSAKCRESCDYYNTFGVNIYVCGVCDYEN